MQEGRFSIAPDEVEATESLRWIQERVQLSFERDPDGILVCAAAHAPTEVGSTIPPTRIPFVDSGTRTSVHPLADRAFEYTFEQWGAELPQPRRDPSTALEQQAAIAMRWDPLWSPFAGLLADRRLRAGDVVDLPPALAMRFVWVPLAAVSFATPDPTADAPVEDPDEQLLHGNIESMSSASLHDRETREKTRAQAVLESVVTDENGERSAVFAIDVRLPGREPTVVAEGGEILEIRQGESTLTGRIHVSLRHGWIVRESYTLVTSAGDGVRPPEDVGRPIFGTRDSTRLERRLERAH